MTSDASSKRKEAELIGKVSFGNSSYILAVDEDTHLLLKDGYPLITSLEPMGVSNPILDFLIDILCKESHNNDCPIVIAEGDWDTADKYSSLEMLARLKKDIAFYMGDTHVLVQEGVTNDAFRERGGPKVTLFAFLQSIESNKQVFSSLVNSAETLMEKTSSLLRVKIPLDMWGADKVYEDLLPCRESKPHFENIIQGIGKSSTDVVRLLTKLHHRLSKGFLNMTEVDKKFLLEEICPVLFEAVRVLQKKVLDYLILLRPIYRLEKNFTKYTGNPACWSLPGNILLDSHDCYEELLEFIIRVPDIEQTLLEPMTLVYKRIKKELNALSF